MSKLTDFKGSKGALTNLNAGAGLPGQLFVVTDDSQVIGSDGIKTPDPVSPLTGTSGVAQNTVLTASVFGSAFNRTRDFRRFEIREAGVVGWGTLIFSEEINTDVSSAISPILGEDSAFEWRCRDVTTDGAMSDWSETQSFTTGNAFVVTPTIWVEGAPSDVPESPTIQTTMFETVGAIDTHVSTDWEVLLAADDSVVYTLNGATGSQLTEIQIPSGILIENTQYKFRARHVGNTLGASAYGETLGTTVEQFFFANTLIVGTNAYGQDGETFEKFFEAPQLTREFVQSSNFEYFGYSGDAFTGLTTLKIFRQIEPQIYEEIPFGQFSPNIQGTATIRSISISPDGEFFEFISLVNPQSTTYQTRLINDVYVQQSIGAGVNLTFSPDSTYASTWSSGGDESRSIFRFLKKDGSGLYNTIIELDDQELPNGADFFSSASFTTKFSSTGEYVGVTGRFLDTTGIHVYRRIGDTFSELTINGTTLFDSSFDPGRTIAVTGNGTYAITSHGEVYKLPAPSANFYDLVPNAFNITPNNPTGNVTISKDDEFVAVSVSVAPYAFIYKRVGDSFIKIAGIIEAPDNGNNLSFDPGLVE